jgi:hypothetical protein
MSQENNNTVKRFAFELVKNRARAFYVSGGACKEQFARVLAATDTCVAET